MDIQAVQEEERRGAKRRKRLPERIEKLQKVNEEDNEYICCCCLTDIINLSHINLSSKDHESINQLNIQFTPNLNKICLPCWEDVQIVFKGSDALKRLRVKQSENILNCQSPDRIRSFSTSSVPTTKSETNVNCSSIDQSDTPTSLMTPASATLVHLANLKRTEDKNLKRSQQSSDLPNEINSFHHYVPTNTENKLTTLRAALGFNTSPPSCSQENEPTKNIDELKIKVEEVEPQSTQKQTENNPLLSLLLNKKPDTNDSRPNLKELLDNDGVKRSRSATWSSDDRLQHSCEHCALRLQTGSALALHKACHITGSPQLHCPLCGWMHNKLSPQWRIMQSHLVKEHAIPRHTFNHLPCSTCGAVLGSSSELLSHVRIHEEIKSTLFDITCPICDLQMIDESESQIHIMCHSSGKSFRCPNCQWQHTTQPSSWRCIKTHLIEEHTDMYENLSNVSGYSCSICHISFLTINGRDLHENMHDDDKYKCTNCLKTVEKNCDSESNSKIWQIMQKHYIDAHWKPGQTDKMIQSAVEHVLLNI